MNIFTKLEDDQKKLEIKQRWMNWFFIISLKKNNIKAYWDFYFFGGLLIFNKKY